MKCDKFDCINKSLWSNEFPCTDCKRNKEKVKPDYYRKVPHLEEKSEK